MKWTVADLVRELGGELHGNPAAILTGVAALEGASPSDLSYAEGERHVATARASRAGCLLLPPGLDAGSRTLIRVAEPKRIFARAVALFHPVHRPAPGIHPTAVVAPSARLGDGVHVGPHATIGDEAVVARGVVVGAGAAIGDRVRIGAESVLMPRVVVYPDTTLGERVLVHAGAVLGSDGFGFLRGPDGLEKFPQVGRLVIEDEVEIGANTTIDRGALGATVIGRGSKLDNLVHVAHNVVVGQHCALSAQVGIAGSSVLGDEVTLAGQVGIADHVRVEAQATVGAQAGVPSHKVIRRGQVVWGTPARPLDEFKRQFAHLSRIVELRERLMALEERLESRLQALAERATRD
jgi:UDP-3-O-[3-hydroxymyristoyl] glucosamine N-acyltransferase